MKKKYTTSRSLHKTNIPTIIIDRDYPQGDPFIISLKKRDFKRYATFLCAAHYVDAFILNGILYRKDSK